MRLPRLPFSRSAAERAGDEVEHHLRLLTAELTAQGMAPDEARREAVRRFGDPERIRAEMAAVDERWEAEERRASWWADLTQDARFAARTLRRAPGYVAVAVLSLAVGIGATTTMVSVVDAIDRRALRFPDGERLARIELLSPADDPACRRCPVSPSLEDLAAWRAGARALDAVEGWDHPVAVWQRPDGREMLNVGRATAGLLPLLGARPVLGRSLEARDDAPGAPLVAVLDEGFWRSRLGADPAIIGSTIHLAARSYERAQPPRAYTIVGIVPSVPGLASLLSDGYQAWTARSAAGDAGTQRRALFVVGRVRPGVALERARLEIESATAAAPLGESGRRIGGVRLTSFRESLLGDFAPGRTRRELLGIAAMVLLLAVVNVASLALARAGARRRELAVRGALGAPRGRLVRQLLTESVCLAAAGGAAGTLLAFWATSFLTARMSLGSLGVRASTDLVALGAALAVSFAAGLSFGLAPALGLSRTGAGEALRAAGARGASRRTSARLEAALVVAQVALALVLLTGAGLLGRELLQLQWKQVGFEPRRLYQLQVQSADFPRGGAPVLRALADETARRLADVPGVVAATVFTSSREHPKVRAERGARAPEALEPFVLDVDGGFFATIGSPVLRGRTFSPGDDPSSVAIVTESAARALWPAGDALGERLHVADAAGGAWLTVVGVVPDARWLSSLRGKPEPVVFRPPQPRPEMGVGVLFRTGEDAGAALAAVFAAVRQIPGASVESDNVRSLEAFIGDQLAGPRLNASVLGGFAVFALLLASMGIYGVVALTVAARTREIGIRIALGAQPAAVVALAARRGVLLSAAGVVAGIAAAAGLTRVLRSMVRVTSTTDPSVFVAAALALALVAALAAWLPARRATRLDPAQVLRAE